MNNTLLCEAPIIWAELSEIYKPGLFKDIIERG